MEDKKMIYVPKMEIGGLIILGLLIAGFIWMYPEIKRYIKMMRM